MGVIMPLLVTAIVILGILAVLFYSNSRDVAYFRDEWKKRYLSVRDERDTLQRELTAARLTIDHMTADMISKDAYRKLQEDRDYWKSHWDELNKTLFNVGQALIGTVKK